MALLAGAVVLVALRATVNHAARRTRAESCRLSAVSLSAHEAASSATDGGELGLVLGFGIVMLRYGRHELSYRLVTRVVTIATFFGLLGGWTGLVLYMVRHA